MQAKPLTYFDGDAALQGHLFQQDPSSQKPAVIVFHDWSGCNPFAIEQAANLAALGYVGFAADIYGGGKTGETVEAKQALMEPFFNNRARLNQRIQAAFNTIHALEGVDQNRIAVMGFCFGGLCALDCARFEARLKAAISFHGILNPPPQSSLETIPSHVLVLHGYDDPMVTPDAVHTFCEEMNRKKADWQVHMYGLTQHAFTNPQANDPSLGTVFRAQAAKRAFGTMTHFLQEVFQDS